MNPLVSVVIPTHNRKKMLRKCLNGLVEQTYRNFEVLVIGSQLDRSENVAKRFKPKLQIKYLRQEGRGPSEARNIGIEAAEGEIVAFTDDDCVPDSNWIENILGSLNDADGVEGVACSSNKKELTPFSHKLISKKSRQFPTCNVAYKHDVLVKVGGFCEKFSIDKLHFREDSDLAFSILEKGGKVKFDKAVRVKHLIYSKGFDDFLSEKRVFELDPLLYRRHPKLYKKYIKFPFEMFTPFYSLLSIILAVGLVFYPWLVLVSFLGLILTGIIELLKRGWKASPLQFLKFLVGQVVGSFITIYSVLKGCWKFRVNPLKLLWVR